MDVAPTLRAALAKLPSRFQGGLVFCGTDGKPIDPDNFARRRWARRVLRRAELRRIRFHNLRRTYASLLIAQGAHPKYIQTQLGHASIQTTLDRYGHLCLMRTRRKRGSWIGWSSVRNGHRCADGVADAVQRVQNGCRNGEGASGADR